MQDLNLHGAQSGHAWPAQIQGLQGLDAPSLGPDASPSPVSPSAQTLESSGYLTQNSIAECTPPPAATAAATIGTWLQHVVVQAVYEGGGELRAADGPLSLKARLLRDAPEAVGQMAAAGGLARFCEANADRLEFLPDPGGGGGVVRLRILGSAGFLGTSYPNVMTAAGTSFPAIQMPLTQDRQVATNALPQNLSLSTAAVQLTGVDNPSKSHDALLLDAPSRPSSASNHASHGLASKAKSGSVSEPVSGIHTAGPNGKRPPTQIGAESKPNLTAHEAALSPRPSSSALPARVRARTEREVEAPNPPTTGTRRSVVRVSASHSEVAQPRSGITGGAVTRPWATAEYKSLELQKLRALREMVVRDFGGGSGGGGAIHEPVSADGVTQRRVTNLGSSNQMACTQRISERIVAQQLARLVAAAGGELSASRAALELYRDSPEARDAVAEAGGLRGVCDRNPALLEFMKDHGAGVIRLGARQDVASAGSLSRQTPGAGKGCHSDESAADSVESELCERMVTALQGLPGGEMLASNVPSRVMAHVQGGREALAAAGGLRSFCERFSSDLEFICAGGRDMVRLRRPTSGVTTSDAEGRAGPATSKGALNSDMVAAGRNSCQASQPQASKPKVTKVPTTVVPVADSSIESKEASKEEVADALAALLSRQTGGEMAVQKAAALLYISMPAARDVVAGAGGMRRFCKSLATVIQFVDDGDGNFRLRLLQVPDGEVSLPEAGDPRPEAASHRSAHCNKKKDSAQGQAPQRDSTKRVDSARASIALGEASAAPAAAAAGQPDALDPSKPLTDSSEQTLHARASGQLSTAHEIATIPDSQSRQMLPSTALAECTPSRLDGAMGGKDVCSGGCAPPPALQVRAAPASGRKHEACEPLATAAAHQAASRSSRKSSAGSTDSAGLPSPARSDDDGRRASLSGADSGAVVQQLMSMLRRAGGAVPSGVAVRRLYAESPWARDCVAACGGFRRLCSANSDLVELAPAGAAGAAAGASGGQGWVLRLVGLAAVGATGAGPSSGSQSGAGAEAAAGTEPPSWFSMEAFPDLSPKVPGGAASPPAGFGDGASSCWGDPASAAAWCGAGRERRAGTRASGRQDTV